VITSSSVSITSCEREIGPCEIMQKINDNAYRLGLAIFEATNEHDTKIQGLGLAISGSGQNRVDLIMTRL
jgi:hypothetical protein